jgi:hypothetical protein
MRVSLFLPEDQIAILPKVSETKLMELAIQVAATLVALRTQAPRLEILFLIISLPMLLILQTVSKSFIPTV